MKPTVQPTANRNGLERVHSQLGNRDLQTPASPVNVVAQKFGAPSRTLSDLAQSLAFLGDPNGGLGQMARRDQQNIAEEATSRAMSEASIAMVRGDYSRPTFTQMDTPQYQEARMKMWGQSMGHQLSNLLNEKKRELLENPELLLSSDPQEVLNQFVKENQLEDLVSDPLVAQSVLPAVMNTQERFLGELREAKLKENRVRAQKEYQDNAFGILNPTNLDEPLPENILMEARGWKEVGLNETEALGTLLNAVSARYNNGDMAAYGLLSHVDPESGLTLRELVQRTGNRGLIAEVGRMESDYKGTLKANNADQKKRMAYMSRSFVERSIHDRSMTPDELEAYIENDPYLDFGEKLTLKNKVYGMKADVAVSNDIRNAILNGEASLYDPKDVKKEVEGMLRERINSDLTQGKDPSATLAQFLVEISQQTYEGSKNLSVFTEMGNRAFSTGSYVAVDPEGNQVLNPDMNNLFMLTRNLYALAGNSRGVARQYLGKFLSPEQTEFMLNRVEQTTSSSGTQMDNMAVASSFELAQRTEERRSGRVYSPSDKERSNVLGQMDRFPDGMTSFMTANLDSRAKAVILDDATDQYTYEMKDNPFPVPFDEWFRGYWVNTAPTRFVHTGAFFSENTVYPLPRDYQVTPHTVDALDFFHGRLKAAIEQEYPDDADGDIRFVVQPNGSYQAWHLRGGVQRPVDIPLPSLEVMEKEYLKASGGASNWLGDIRKEGFFKALRKYGPLDTAGAYIMGDTLRKRYLDGFASQAGLPTKRPTEQTLEFQIPEAVRNAQYPVEQPEKPVQFNKVNEVRRFITSNPGLAVAIAAEGFNKGTDGKSKQYKDSDKGNVLVLGLNLKHQAPEESKRFLENAGIHDEETQRKVLNGEMGLTLEQSYAVYQSAMDTKYRPQLRRVFKQEGLDFDEMVRTGQLSPMQKAALEQLAYNSWDRLPRQAARAIRTGSDFSQLDFSHSAHMEKIFKAAWQGPDHLFNALGAKL